MGIDPNPNPNCTPWQIPTVGDMYAFFGDMYAFFGGHVCFSYTLQGGTQVWVVVVFDGRLDRFSF